MYRESEEERSMYAMSDSLFRDTDAVEGHQRPPLWCSRTTSGSRVGRAEHGGSVDEHLSTRRRSQRLLERLVSLLEEQRAHRSGRRVHRLHGPKHATL